MTDPLTEKDHRAIVEFVTRLEHLFPSSLYGVVLYGSKARGEATVDSDIDLLVILDERSRQNRIHVNKVASRVSLEFGVLLLPHVIAWAQWQQMMEGPFTFFKEVFKDGVPVYGKPAIFTPLRHRDVTPLYNMVMT